MSSEDKKEKVKGVDIFCVVDVSGSMVWDGKIELVKQSLNYLVNLMNEDDYFSLVKFSYTATLVNNLTQMTSENKTKILNSINDLYATGGTNIYSGLKESL